MSSADAKRPSLAALGFLNWCGHVLLALGLGAPCMIVTPKFGAIEGLARWLGLLQDPETYSILSGTWRLLTGGQAVIGVVLLVFSVLFPVAKLVALRAAIADVRRGRAPGPAPLLAARFSKYSMVDVFVIALLVLVSKTFPGGTTVEVAWGTYAFAGAALLSVLVAAGLSRHL